MRKFNCIHDALAFIQGHQNARITGFKPQNQKHYNIQTIFVTLNHFLRHGKISSWPGLWSHDDYEHQIKIIDKLFPVMNESVELWRSEIFFDGNTEYMDFDNLKTGDHIEFTGYTYASLIKESCEELTKWKVEVKEASRELIEWNNVRNIMWRIHTAPGAKLIMNSQSSIAECVLDRRSKFRITNILSENKNMTIHLEQVVND